MHAVPSGSSATERSASAERARVASHLSRAEAVARSSDLTALSFLQRLVRTLLLDELSHYRRRGRFPRQALFHDNTPCFVDLRGTPCAVAHLLALSGETPLVQRIARERNYARVRELVDEPRLVAWLAAAGLALEEAAAIQPDYCYERADCICGESRGEPSRLNQAAQPAAGVLVGTMLRSSGMQLVMRVDRLYGDTGAFEVGSEIVVDPSFYSYPSSPQPIAGNMLLVPVHKPEADASSVPAADADFSPPAPTAIALSAEGTFSCKSEGFKAVGPLQAEQLTVILQASDCLGAVDALNSKWTEHRCDEGMMCSSSPDAEARSGASATLDILLFLVSALVARRMARRESRT
jgi:hypothetical protein